ncbi:MAG: heme exporter protein CcmB [Desulfovibrio sp.]|nr:heme exporter protein CcmB [Desulfovibrio sp.]
MWRICLAIIQKDCTILLLRGSSVLHAILLGLLLIFTFSFSLSPGDTLSCQTSATIFWISSLFCLILLFNQLFAVEETNGQRFALSMLPSPPFLLWLAKTATGLGLLLISQLVFLPACIVFLGHAPSPNTFLITLANITITDLGICSLGSLLGALAQGQASKESLLSILLFPLLTPLLLAGISIHSQCMEGLQENISQWFTLATAFDCIFLASTSYFFSFIYSDDE